MTPYIIIGSILLIIVLIRINKKTKIPGTPKGKHDY